MSVSSSAFLPISRTLFLPSCHGFPYPNGCAAGSPLFDWPTPFGHIRFGDARAGVCGGMVYAALDLYHYGLPVPVEPTPTVLRYLVRRLLASWDPPFGGLRYYLWQTRPRLTRVTVREEWPKVRAMLDAGHPAPLGLVQVHSPDPRQIIRNHQVLAYNYDASDTEVSLRIYDPNWPGDDGLTLTFALAPEREQPVIHGMEGPTIRGFFLTEYRKPLVPPCL